MEKVCALLPCYNVAKYCAPLLEKVLLYASWLVIIDDGSTDGTYEILYEMQHKHQDRVHLIVFPHNQGKGVALLEGMKHALASIPFQILITLDADGQHLPNEIPALIAGIVTGNAQLVIGCRQFHQMPLRSRYANRFISFLLHRLFSEAPADTQSGFRAFNRQLTEAIVHQITGGRYEMEFRCIVFALHKGYKIISIPIQTIYLDANRSSHFAKCRDSFRILSVFFRYWRYKEL